ncbi:MAG: cell division protein [Gammaproteobacteria bacterium RIFCSPHIGHO2_12_FULL_45_9]|nr:MAG: cell division protein [Gammaproteobacteria bacterium RIFCSPHIGHO2_12_FULL_45_9]
MQRTLRLSVVVGLLSCVVLGLVARLIYLAWWERPFLLKQSEVRIVRKIQMPAYRGMLLDRTGMPLGITTPVESIWVNPAQYMLSKGADEGKKAQFVALSTRSKQLEHQLATLLDIPCDVLSKRLHPAMHPGEHHEFVYVERSVSEEIAERVRALHIPGLYFQSEYRRSYPEGEVAAHVLGMTNVDERGIEGLELAYNDWLGGSAGIKEVVKDRMGHVIADVALLKEPVQGHDIMLSLDHRFQYAAYHAIKQAVIEAGAESGSVIILDAHTGEVLAMANVPSYDPNAKRVPAVDGRYRNRAVTDLFEPGSVMKPFTVIQALLSGHYTPDSQIDTAPGWLDVGGYRISDDGRNGVVNLTQLLAKSSNIAAAKILLAIGPEQQSQLLQRLGFGVLPHSGFPGEAVGQVMRNRRWEPSEIATLAYGYGISVTALQLAQAYLTVANHGVHIPITFLKRDTTPMGERLLPQSVADTVLNMLRSVVEEGTGTRARVPGYAIAGKTGTAYIAGPNGYRERHYMSSFVGVGPLPDPRLVIVVVMRDPKKAHMAGYVSAPVFSQVMQESLHLLSIPPDPALMSTNRVA